MKQDPVYSVYPGISSLSSIASSCLFLVEEGDCTDWSMGVYSVQTLTWM